jgi:subfamily B ATP-binding cassette protein MsbA
MRLLLDWVVNSSQYGLKKIHISIFFVLGLLSSISEIIGLSIFVPIFHFMGEGELVAEEGSDKLLSYILSFYEKINITPNFEVLLITAFLLFFISKTIIFSTRIYHILIYNELLMLLREKIFSDYMDTKIEYKDKVPIGSVVNSITGEARSVISGIILPIKFMILVVSVVVSLIALFIISYQMTILTGFLVLLVFLLPLRWINATSQVSVKVSRKNSELSSFIVNRLNSSRLFKFSGTQNLEFTRFKKITSAHKRLLKLLQILKARTDYVVEPVLLGVSLILVYLGSAYYSLELEFIALFLLILVRVIPIFKDIMSQLQVMNRMIGPTKLVGDLLDEMDLNREHDYGKEEISGFHNQISVQHVGYKFPGNNNKILNDINFSINKGELVAIVGPSGSGKSTMVDLIMRMRNPSHGNIKIDNELIQSYSLSSLRNMVSYAPQETCFFSATVKEHINYGKQSTHDKDTVESAHLVGADIFINELDKKYDSDIGVDNIRLSGGQKKRLDLARAINGYTPIIILDEPGGGLDPSSSEGIYNALVQVHKKKNNTIITTTHDIKFISRFDKIIVINKGSIEAIGTHKELIKQKGWYRSAYKTYD